ncbi:hypothetical protein NKJ73_23700 [Mesorhizobium sp. M0074]|uniref:hypothetical protein n=1 Tax=unclassified Mesorhizobium TaxID=325217 RepID=UPI00333ACE14
MVYFFALCSFLALLGFFINSKRRNGHGMAYSAAMIVIWMLAALWWSGRIG